MRKLHYLSFVKVLIFSLISLFVVKSSYSASLDSLLNAYLKTKDSFQRIKIAENIAKENMKTNVQLSIEYYQNAFNLSEKLAIDSLQLKYARILVGMSAYNTLELNIKFIEKVNIFAKKSANLKYRFAFQKASIRYLLNNKEAEKAKLYLDDLNRTLEIIKKSEKNPSSLFEYNAEFLHTQLDYFQDIGKLDLARKAGDELLHNAKKSHDKSLLYNAYQFVGIHNQKLGEYETALKYFNLIFQDKDLSEKIDDLSKATMYLNMGNCFRALGRLREAEDKYLECLSLKIKNKASETSIASTYSNLGGLAKDMGNFKLAFESYEKAMEIYKKLGNTQLVGVMMLNIGSLYYKTGNNAKSYEYLSYVEKNHDFSSFPEAKLELLQDLSEIYEVRGDYKKSLEMYKKYRATKDSIFTNDLRLSVKKYQEMYEAEKKDKKIVELTNEKEISLLKEQKQTAKLRLFIGFAVFLVIILIISIFWFVNKRKVDKAIYAKNQEISRREMLELISQQDVNTVNAFMKGQEKERGRIASDLHDRLGSLLSTVKLHFSSIETTITDPENKENFEYAIKLLDKSVSEVRSVSHNLTKEVLTQLGLIHTIENLVEAINSAGKLKINLFTPGTEQKFSSEIEIELYRVIQETLTNIIKHANASEVTIQFLVNNNMLNLIIEDDGVGFDPAVVKSDGMGLSNIYNRVNKIKGTYSIDSSPGAGSTFIFDIPLED